MYDSLIIDGKIMAIACKFPRKIVIPNQAPLTKEELKTCRLIGRACLERKRKEYAEKGDPLYVNPRLTSQTT